MSTCTRPGTGRRVTLVVILSERELFPRYFWLIASLAREDAGAEDLRARYRVRGEAENTFGEMKSKLRVQRPSSPRPRRQYAGNMIERSYPPAETEWRPENEALFLLALLAYQTMHQGRCAMEDASGKGWSLGCAATTKGELECFEYRPSLAVK